MVEFVGRLGCSHQLESSQRPVGSPRHVHIHLRQTLGQVAVTVHLGEPGETETKSTVSPDKHKQTHSSVCGHHPHLFQHFPDKNEHF